MAEERELSDFALSLVKAISLLAVAGAGWKVAMYILTLIGV